MNLERLLQDHQIIGWDVDGTILDHPAAQAMHDYIRAHPEKQHFVITFRSHGLEREIWLDMDDEHDTKLDPNLFDGVINTPNETYRAYHVALRQSPLGERDPAVTTYLEWKGRVCHERGITVLVDDMTDQVIRGCDRYGILHIHPDWFL